eukprot:COSAG02_NODE_2188_length_9569_cov_21.824710_10_plen_74_part_00
MLRPDARRLFFFLVTSICDNDLLQCVGSQAVWHEKHAILELLLWHPALCLRARNLFHPGSTTFCIMALGDPAI